MLDKAVVPSTPGWDDAGDLYTQFFVPVQHAIGSVEQTALFEIFSAVDYSIPVKFSSESMPLDVESNA